MRREHVGGAFHLGVVEPAQALVRQQQLGPGGQRARELELLQRRGAEPVTGRPRSAGQSHHRQRRCRAPRVPGCGIDAAAALAVKGGERHVLEERQPAERARDLEGARDAQAADAMRRGSPPISRAVERGSSRRSAPGPGDQVEDGALARAVRADQAQNLALPRPRRKRWLTARKPPKRLVSPADLAAPEAGSPGRVGRVGRQRQHRSAVLLGLRPDHGRMCRWTA